MSLVPVLTKKDLVDYLASGCKPHSQWRIGTEYEKFVFTHADFRRVSYEGEKASIRGLLEGLIPLGWEAVYEGIKVISLKHTGRRASITLEPGGQFELSGAPLASLHETNQEFDVYTSEVIALSQKMGVCLLSMGFDPLTPRESVPWMPKGRYALMKAHMPKKGKLGLDMMTRTSTVQVNLDFETEADMVAKMRIGMALQPVVSALFASSPLTEGRPNGYKSYRSAVWQDTDPDRCGLLDFVFDENMGFERYVDYLLSIPMYFIYRNGSYIDALGRSFSDLMAGEIDIYRDEFATLNDWADHLTIAFPEVRLKRFIEMRGADAGPRAMSLALPALWTGLLYSKESMVEAIQLTQDWTIEEIHNAYVKGPKQGFDVEIQGRTLLDIARDVVSIAERGLTFRHILNVHEEDESIYLAPLKEIVTTGRTVADDILTQYAEGGINQVMRAYGCNDEK